MKRGESHVTGQPATEVGRGRQPAKMVGKKKGNQMSKDEGGRNSSFSEKPVRSRPRRLADWINPTGAKNLGISEDLSLRESCMRENCTRSLGGGRRPARQRASSDPTRAEQHVVREGSSPSGARMRSVISESGGNSSLAGKMLYPEGRVSIARWNLKGMRRSTGL